MNMRLKLTVTEPTALITKNILKAFLPEITKNVSKGITIIKSELPLLVNKAVTTSPEYQQLIGGTLKLELGIPNASTKIAGLISTWSSSINYRYVLPKISGNKIISVFSANVFKSDFSDVLGTEYAQVADSLRGYSLPWLEWLLLKGNAPIIRDHQVVFGYNKRSRTGQAIMRVNTKKSWSVPSPYSGTISDNWITRSINNISPDINNLLDRAFL